MRDAHRTVGGVDRLATRSARTEHVDAQVLIVDMDVDLLRFGQHCYRRRRGMDAAAALGLRHPLHAMDARFKFEALEDVATADRRDRFLEAADTGLRYLHHLEAPAMLRGVALIHPEKLGGEQCRLLAAGAGA